jgi:hypothetical protein
MFPRDIISPSTMTAQSMQQDSISIKNGLDIQTSEEEKTTMSPQPPETGVNNRHTNPGGKFRRAVKSSWSSWMQQMIPFGFMATPEIFGGFL